MKEWGHHSSSHVTETDYSHMYEKIQSAHYYADRVQEEYPTCKLYQEINVSKVAKRKSSFFLIIFHLVAIQYLQIELARAWSCGIKVLQAKIK